MGVIYKQRVNWKNIVVELRRGTISNFESILLDKMLIFMKREWNFVKEKVRIIRMEISMLHSGNCAEFKLVSFVCIPSEQLLSFNSLRV